MIVNAKLNAAINAQIGHELENSNRYVAIASYIAVNFLQWFVSEQLEEISSAQTRLSVIKRAGPSVLMVEAYLAHGGG